MLVIFTGLFGFVALFGYARWIEPNLLSINRLDIHIQNLPKEFQGLRIVQISDLHGKEVTGNNLVQKANNLQPDILVITGDIFDSTHQDITYISRSVGLMKARLGVFYVTGNNEYRSHLPIPKIDQTLENAGIRVLHNKNYRLNYKGKHLWLIGVDDPSTERDKLDNALLNTDASPKILLAHSPEIIGKVNKHKIDLVLTGHTHGGQLRIPGITNRPNLQGKVEKVFEWANSAANRIISYIWVNRDKLNKIEIPTIPENINKPEIKLPRTELLFTHNMKPEFQKFVAGYYQVGSTQLYVNRGIGETWIPMRLFSPPEITIITLVSKGK